MEKRDRGKNFTEAEKEQLMRIAFKYRSVIENKKTDKINVRRKNETWKRIEEEFNAIQTTGARGIKALKILYDNLKMKARKEKKKIIASGGGSRSLPMTPLPSIIVSELADQYEPLQNPYGSSSSYYREDIPILEEPNKMTDREPSAESVIEASVDIGEDENFNLDGTVTSIHSMKRKLGEVYDTLNEISSSEIKRNLSTVNMLQEEHRLKMDILKLEKETAEVNLHNANKKQLILDLNLSKVNMLQEEHRLKMDILKLEKETAEVNLHNAKQKQLILDLKLKKLLG